MSARQLDKNKKQHLYRKQEIQAAQIKSGNYQQN